MSTIPLSTIKYLPLGEICEIYDGTHQTPTYTKSGIKFVSVENIRNLYGTTKYISQKDFNKYKVKPQIDDVIMTRIGSVGECAVIDKKEDLAFYVSLALLRPNKAVLDSRYLKHVIESSVGKKELNKKILFNAIPLKINKNDIGKLIIPLPPLKTQIYIASVLDGFEKLINNINTGLPAEIQSRKNQYEYYRNKLLTFA